MIMTTPNAQFPTPNGSSFTVAVFVWELEVGSWEFE